MSARKISSEEELRKDLDQGKRMLRQLHEYFEMLERKLQDRIYWHTWEFVLNFWNENTKSKLIVEPGEFSLKQSIERLPAVELFDMKHKYELTSDKCMENMKSEQNVYCQKSYIHSWNIQTKVMAAENVAMHLSSG